MNNELTELELLLVERAREQDGDEAAEHLVTSILMVRDAREQYIAGFSERCHAERSLR